MISEKFRLKLNNYEKQHLGKDFCELNNDKSFLDFLRDHSEVCTHCKNIYLKIN
jgi:hypothetical protein